MKILKTMQFINIAHCFFWADRKVTNAGYNTENAKKKNYNAKSSKPEHSEPVTNCPL